jgi:surfactin synthase thioesterase subunit
VSSWEIARGPAADDAASWIVPAEPSRAGRCTLLCCPHAGGGPSAFHAWGPLLPEGADLSVIALPGRETRFGEPALTRVEQLIPPLLQAVRHAVPPGFALLGHSSGAIVVFELTRRLLQTGGPRPALVVVAGCHAPHVAALRQRQAAARACRDARGARLSDLPAPELLDLLSEYAGPTQQAVQDPELLELVLPAIRADLALIDNYAPHPPPSLPVPIHGLAGRSDPIVPPAEVARWEEVAGGGFDMSVFDGDHFFMYERGPAVLALVTATLERHASAVGRPPAIPRLPRWPGEVRG